MDPFEQAIRQIDQPESEICAFLDFLAALKEHLEIPCQSWERAERDPPDFYLRTTGRRVGIEVTNLKACKALLEANARVDALNCYLRRKTRELSMARAVEILFVPDSANSIPDPLREPERLAPILECLNGLPEIGTGAREVQMPFGTFWVHALPQPRGGVHVVDQAFFPVHGENAWSSDINEAIARKVQKYQVAPCAPCWLLLNLKPYLPARNDATRFLSARVAIEDSAGTARVFERVYALTEYIPDADGRVRCPVVRLA